MTTRRVESAVQILILLIIAAMAGAASFTHVHDWTMHNAPTNTGNWFGWANAIISELTPTAAGLEIRRRKRHHQPIGYPMAVLIAAATLSLSAQVAEAKASPTGWLLAAVPALAFLALSKLVLSRTTPTVHDDPATAVTPVVTASPARTEQDTTPSLTTAPSAPPAPETDDIPVHLLSGARMAAFSHYNSTGQPITTAGLADHLGIPPTLAAHILTALEDTGHQADTVTPTTHVNGTAPARSSQ